MKRDIISTVMDVSGNNKIIQYLAGTYGISLEQAKRLVDELPSLFSLTAEEYVRRRHLVLQEQGMKNSLIYRQISRDLEGMVFSAEKLTERQIRRIIYG